MAGETTEAMIAATITGTTIVCVSANSHTAPARKAATPTSSHDASAQVAQPLGRREDAGQLAGVDLDELVAFRGAWRPAHGRRNLVRFNSTTP